MCVNIWNLIVGTDSCEIIVIFICYIFFICTQFRIYRNCVRGRFWWFSVKSIINCLPSFLAIAYMPGKLIREIFFLGLSNGFTQGIFILIKPLFSFFKAYRYYQYCINLHKTVFLPLC